MELDRMDFLKRLLAVSPALTTTDVIKQSSCLVFRRGRIYTMNREVSCSINSKLPGDFEAVIVGKRPIALLKRLPDAKCKVVAFRLMNLQGSLIFLFV